MVSSDLLASLDFAYNQMVRDVPIPELTYDDKEHLALFPTWTGWRGAGGSADASTAGKRGWHAPMAIGGHPAVSCVLKTSNLIASTASSLVNGFEIFSSCLFGSIQLDNESVERSAGDGAVIELKTFEIKSILRTMANVLYQHSFRDGSGTIGQVSTSSSASATSFTLVNPSDATLFEIGDRIVSCATTNGTDRALNSYGQGAIVGALNRDTGVISFKNPLTGALVANNDATYGIPALVVGDYLARQDTRNKVIKGFSFYCPATAPVNGDNCWGLDRSQDVTRLSGTRYDGTSDTPLEAVVRAGNKLAKNNGMANTGIVDYSKFSDMVLELSSRGMVNFLEVKADSAPGFSFTGLKVYTGCGDVNVIPSHGCPTTQGELLDPTEWILASVNDLIHTGGGKDTASGFLRITDNDVIAGYWVSYSQLVPTNPQNMCNILFPAS
jgi:hypothetical protein